MFIDFAAFPKLFFSGGTRRFHANAFFAKVMDYASDYFLGCFLIFIATFIFIFSHFNFFSFSLPSHHMTCIDSFVHRLVMRP